MKVSKVFRFVTLLFCGALYSAVGCDKISNGKLEFSAKLYSFSIYDLCLAKKQELSTMTDNAQLSINCKELKKTYPGKNPVEAVRGIDLEVLQGECFGLLGPNGAGKTTTIEILEGISQPTSGQVEILGMNWNQDGSKIRQQIGVSLQETELSEKLSVLETIRFFRSFYPTGISPEEAIARVGLQEKTNAWVKTLSGGQKQRLAVAISIVGDPQLLFLDEPTTGLDPVSRRQLWDIIDQFKAEGRTVMITTHYMEEAEKLCDRVAIVDQGVIVTIGSPRQLIADLGSEHVMECSIETGSVSSENVVSELSSLPAIVSATSVSDHFSLSSSDPNLSLPAMLELFRAKQWRLINLTTRQSTLEDVFMARTGKNFAESEPETAA